LAFVPTWADVAYVCLIFDVFFRIIVGLRCVPHVRTEMALDAIEMARWGRGTSPENLRCHSNADSQFTSFRYGERIAKIELTPLLRAVGVRCDHALAKTVNGHYNTELVKGPSRSGPWETVEDLEPATLGWVHWQNTQRIHCYLGFALSAELEAGLEAEFNAGQTGRSQLVGIK
jgi:putative transposase